MLPSGYWYLRNGPQVCYSHQGGTSSVELYQVESSGGKEWLNALNLDASPLMDGKILFCPGDGCLVHQRVAISAESRLDKPYGASYDTHIAKMSALQNNRITHSNSEQEYKQKECSLPLGSDSANWPMCKFPYFIVLDRGLSK